DAAQLQSTTAGDLVGSFVDGSHTPGLVTRSALPANDLQANALMASAMVETVSPHPSPSSAVDALDLSNSEASAVLHAANQALQAGRATANVQGFSVDWGVWDQRDALAIHGRAISYPAGTSASDVHWALIQ